MSDHERLIFLHAALLGAAAAHDPNLHRKLAAVLGLPPDCLQSPESAAIEREVLEMVAAVGRIEAPA